MAIRGSAGLLRNPDAPKRATLLELLFDVAYVAALALTSISLAGNVSWARGAQLLVLLMAIWWTWSITTLLTDFYDPQRLPIQAMIAGTMFGSILMTATVPSAFSAHGLVFAIAYVSIHVGRGLGLVTALRGHQAQRRAARFLVWFGISGIAWISGAISTGPTRGMLWALALAIDYTSAALRYPVPGLGRVPLSQYDKTSEHLGERYQQFVILALGDLVLVPTLRISGTGVDSERVVTFIVAIATTLMLWQIYVHHAGEFLQVAINRRPGRSTRSAPYTHLLMVAGIVSAAAGFELAIGRPTGDTPVGWVIVIFGGPALFLVGRATFEYAVFGRISWSRLVWLLALIAVAPTMVYLPPMLVTIVVSMILLGIAITDAIRGDPQRPARPGRRSDASERPVAGT
jgi:low temperature requirement protein LtrA